MANVVNADTTRWRNQAPPRKSSCPETEPAPEEVSRAQAQFTGMAGERGTHSMPLGGKCQPDPDWETPGERIWVFSKIIRREKKS